MPFGNSCAQELEADGSVPGLVAAQARPFTHRLAHGARTTARALAPPRHQPPGPFQEALRQLRLLPRAQQVAAQGQRQPCSSKYSRTMDSLTALMGCPRDSRPWQFAESHPRAGALEHGCAAEQDYSRLFA